MGFPADLVNDVQAEMHCDDVGPLLERLAELTRTEDYANDGTFSISFWFWIEITGIK